MAKILIVEDDAILQSAYNTVLSMEGFEVFTAPDGVEGLRVANEQSPDVILLDMLMPNLNGIDFLRSYDVKTKHPNSRVIVFSNISVPESMKEAMQLGAVKYLTKASFTPKEMVAVIKEVLGQTQAQSGQATSG